MDAKSNDSVFAEIAAVTRGYGCYYPEIRFLIHPCSIRLTRFLAKRGVSPNAVSYAMAGISIVVIALLVRGHPFAALGLYWIRTVLDYTDGSLARFTKRTSPFGAKLDRIVDYLFYLPLWVVLARLFGIEPVWVGFLVPAAYVVAVDFFVEPRLKTLRQRAPFKAKLMKKGIILGFAPFGILEFWGMVVLTCGAMSYYPYLLALCGMDLIHRLYEVVRYRPLALPGVLQ